MLPARLPFVALVSLLAVACGPSRPSAPDDDGPGTIGGGGGGGSPDAGTIVDTGDGGVRGCRSNDDCDPGSTCFLTVGLCVPDSTTIPVGDRCQDSSACNGGVCLDAVAGGYCTIPCASDSECGLGGHCLRDDSVCTKNCSANSQCSDGYECVNRDGDTLRECTEASAPVERPIGDACQSDSDCGDGGECFLESLSSGNLGGYCSAACSSSADCGPTGSCVGGKCGKTCTTKSQCRSGYDCLTASGGTKICISSSSGTTRVGAACTRYTQCQGGPYALCLTAWPSGYCSQECTNASCPTGATCVQDSQDSSVQFCVDDCSDTDTCRGSYSCQDLGNSVLVCGPA